VLQAKLGEGTYNPHLTEDARDGEGKSLCDSAAAKEGMICQKRLWDAKFRGKCRHRRL
jgi:hypothetical protein